MMILLLAAVVYGIGVVAYAFADDGKEKPEPIETDVEHGADGKPLSKRDPLYWATVVAEGLFSYPAAALRKLLGLAQK